MKSGAMVGAVAAGLWMVLGAFAVPPRVIRAMPDMADVGVDPGLGVITIEFDSEMAGTGYSMCGGGPQFPVITGKGVWKSTRTFEVPVRLEAGKTYAFSVNCPAGQNFKSVAGEAAVAYPISFRTRGEGEPESARIGKEAWGAAIDKLGVAIDTAYSHKEIKGVDWAKDLTALKSRAPESATPGELARAVAKMLAGANDLHISVRLGEFVLGTASRSVQPNYDLKTLTKLVKNWTQHNKRVVTGEYGGVPYVLIGDWMGPKEEYEPVFEFLKTHKDAPGLIVDVRPNAGGDELIAREVAGCFVKERAVYSRNKYRTPEEKDGWTQVFDRAIEPTANRPEYRGKVCVLMGRANMSSNESFLCMMRFGAGATLVGDFSYGSSGNPKPRVIGEGVTVVLPSWLDMTPHGTRVEGIGIAPDEPVEYVSAQGGMETPDTVLGAAWRLLQPKNDKDP